MIKNTADQIISFQLISTTDGSDVTTGTPAVYVTGDGGAQGAGAGTITHEGNGCWSYVVSAANSNYSHVSFTIVLAGALSQTVNVYPITLADYKATGFSTHSAADVKTAIEAAGSHLTLILEDTGTTIPGTITTMQGNVTSILADTNELQIDWVDGGRLDLLLDGASSAGDPWTTALPGAYGAGTAGLLLGTTIPAAIADVPTVAEFEARSLVSADYTVVTDLGTVQTADHTAAIADIPTVAEFNARSLLSADYTVVSDLGTVQTADHTAAIADIPTVAEFEARTLPSADYFNTTTDTVTLANGAHGGAALTITGKSIVLTNSDAGGIALDIAGTGTGNSHAIKLASTNAKAIAVSSINSDAISIDASSGTGVVITGGTADITSDINGTLTTCTTNTDMLTAGVVKTAMEADNSDLDYLVTDLVNKKSIKIATGISTQYDDANTSLGAIATGYADDGVDVSRPRQVIVKV